MVERILGEGDKSVPDFNEVMRAILASPIQSTNTSLDSRLQLSPKEQAGISQLKGNPLPTNQDALTAYFGSLNPRILTKYLGRRIEDTNLQGAGEGFLDRVRDYLREIGVFPAIKTKIVIQSLLNQLMKKIICLDRIILIYYKSQFRHC